jgi:hypothetical protein
MGAAGVVLAAVTMAGAACGADSRDAANSATGGGVANSIRGLIGVPGKDASVRVGNFCSDEGSVAKTSDGKAATCVKKSGEKQARWAESAGDAAPVVKGSVRVGNFCSDEGAIGQTSDGKQTTCTKKSRDKQARWAEAKAGSVSIPGNAHPGAFCAPQGANGKSDKGQTYKCTKKSGEQQARWRQ